MPGLGDARVHLVARKLTALTGFGALSHLDLNVSGIHQVVTGHPEAARRHLLDRAAQPRIVEPFDVLAALAAVGPATEVVHRDRHGLVCFGRNRAVAHGAGVEAGADGLDGLHLGQRNRFPDAGFEAEESAQITALAG